MRARLIVEAGIASPRVCELSTDGIAQLGRDRENTVVLKDRYASRWHAQVYASNGRWFIRDQQTTNGTRVDGHPVQQEAPLESGQQIHIGGVRLRFTLDPSKEPTDELPPLPAAEGEPTPSPAPGDSEPTVLQADELTALFRFMNDSLAEATPHRLVSLALEAVLRQTRADLAGFLSLEEDSAEFKLVLPERARVDRDLSRQLTQEVLRTGRSVWLGPERNQRLESDSLAHFSDALCVPLKAPKPAGPEGPPEAPLGALHAYKSNRPFTEREVRFCEVLAGSLAGTLHVLRARRALEADNSRLRVHSAGTGEELVGNSPAMHRLRQQIDRLANCPCTVLIVGESGVGKELVALGLHRQSPRHGGPLIPVNCAAITASMPESELFGHLRGAFTGATDDRPGFFLQADMGTLFLDEIGELSLDLQAKLLRAIETKRFRPVGASAEVKADVRIIAATNRDLEREAREGRFRKDLFYRLTSRIDVPPLREHPEDIPDLVEHFVGRLGVEYRRRVALSEAALERLKAYSWPGNVRQLRSVLETAVANAGPSGVLHAGDLHLVEDASAPPERPPSLNLVELEEWAVRQALERTGGNNTQAAKLLGIHRDTLINKLKKYEIDRRG